MKKLCYLVVGSLSLMVFSPNTSAAETLDQQVISAKLNIAGRQRMLSQRIAKAACFANIDVQKNQHMNMLKDASALFDKSHSALTKGDANQNLTVEKNTLVLQGFSNVEELWRGYKQAIDNSLSEGAVSNNSMILVDVLNIPTLKQMHSTVNMIETVYAGETGRHPSLSAAINLAGAQRMLTQKASKEFCFIQANINKDMNKARLDKTVKRFEKVLTALIKGNEALGLSEAPTPEIQKQLLVVQDLWNSIKSILEKSSSGSSVSAAEIDKVATNNNKLLVEMNKAVQMYVKL